MEFREIKKMMELFSASQIDSLELNRDGFSLKLAKKRGKTSSESGLVPETTAGYEPPPAVVSQEPPSVPKVETAVEEEPESPDLNYVKSPIVGTFYAAPNPKAPAFVKVGDRISVGQTLCIVEAMKLMNEIQSEIAGELVTCYAENAQGVEFGQKLFAIKPY